MAGKQRYGFIRPRTLAKACALGRSEGLVFAALCTFADPNGSSIFPSQQAIAELVNLKARAVTYAIANLASAGIIVKVGHGPRGVVKWRIAAQPGPHPGAELNGSQVSTPVRTCVVENLVENQVEEVPGPHPGAVSGPHPGANDHTNGPYKNKKRLHRARLPACARTREAPNVEAAQPPRDQEPELATGPALQPDSRSQPDPADDLAVGRVLVGLGLFRQRPEAERVWAAAELARAYRRRWPRSSALDWIRASAWPQLSGIVRAPAAWLMRHLDGYGREGWEPRLRDGRGWRKWHRALLEGDVAKAERLARLENSYAPERTSRLHRADLKGPKREGPPRALADLLPPHLAGEAPMAAQA